MPSSCDSRFERQARKCGYCRIAGVDEVGRGALFGPVFAAAVILDIDHPIRGLRDSKQLDAETREAMSAFARRLGLVETGGSDYHGDHGPYAESHAELVIPLWLADGVRAALAERSGRSTMRAS